MPIFEDYPPSGVAVRCKCCGKIEYYSIDDIAVASIRNQIRKDWPGLI